MVLSQIILLSDYYFGFTVPGKVLHQVTIQTKAVVRRINDYSRVLCFSDHILCIVRHRRVLHDEPASGRNAVFHVHEHLPTDFFRRAIGGSCSRRGDERAEWRVPGAGDVGAFPPLLRILRQLRCDPGLSTMDHVPQLHQIRFRGNRFDHLRLWPGETKVFPGRLNTAHPRTLIVAGIGCECC